MNKEIKSAIARVQTARHPERPYSMDLVTTVFTDFIELHGDRRYADDAAIVCGFARLNGMEVAFVGQQKGRDTNQRRFRNFAMPKPEGYRKALRVMRLAEKFRRPVITFIDTPGAYPGIDAEERGQAEAIAYNLREMASLKTPIIAVVLGEGGSGGALAIGVGDRVVMLENAVYSVISPEGCAAILWKDASQAGRAAESLRLTAADLINFGLVDRIVHEPFEWQIPAVENALQKKPFEEIAVNLKEILIEELANLLKLGDKQRLNLRYQKFRQMGQWL
jgi:acetyl-CoA carboxylase carboxyl transferase subunit alpha